MLLKDNPIKAQRKINNPFSAELSNELRKLR